MSFNPPSDDSLFYLQKGNVYAIPILHYTMEFAVEVQKVFAALKPDCVAVELPENMELQLLHAASRLPDISVVLAQTSTQNPLYYMCEPCDAAFEGLRAALENRVNAHCIDLDVEDYPPYFDPLPDAYAVGKIGLKKYYEIYRESKRNIAIQSHPLNYQREQYMAKRLKELSFSFDRILFIGGMAHVESIFHLIDSVKFPISSHAKRDIIQLCTLTENSMRNGLAECGWISSQHEKWRAEFTQQQNLIQPPLPDRHQLHYTLYKLAAEKYTERTGNSFAGYNMRNLMKFCRNYALIQNQLMPNLYQLLASARGCVDGNFAYETWELATTYDYRKNIDNLPELDLSVEELWGHSKKIKFHLKHPSRKDFTFKKRPDKSKFKFQPPSGFGICSYPPEDVAIENFGDFLKKKGVQILTEEAARVAPFSTSIEDGIDARETIRHWLEKKIYVKIKGKPPGAASSIVLIFDEDEERQTVEKYPWKLSWLGEHSQESDMAFYATPMNKEIVGPGISRCEYGGFMLSSPPRRIQDIWNDPDYQQCRSKAEVLLVAAIDYAVKPLIIYVAAKPPRSLIKSFAARYGKKVVFIPIGQLSSVLLNKIRVFHVLDGYHRRQVADEYIY